MDLNFCLAIVHFLVIQHCLLILNSLSFTILTLGFLLCFCFFHFGTGSVLLGRAGGRQGGFHITHGPCNTSIWVNSFIFIFIHILVRGLGFWFRGGWELCPRKLISQDIQALIQHQKHHRRMLTTHQFLLPQW